MIILIPDQLAHSNMGIVCLPTKILTEFIKLLLDLEVVIRLRRLGHC